MPLYVKTYYSIEETKDTLYEIYEKAKECSIFVVPTSLDKENLTNFISRDGSFFGSRPHVFTVGELYRQLSRQEGKTRCVIDPPDHNLILKYLLDSFISEMDKEDTAIPEGIKHKGFVKILGENIKDLLSEDITPEYLQSVLKQEETPDMSLPEFILLRLYRDYISYLEKNGLADAGQTASLLRYLVLLGKKTTQFVEQNKFIFVGFLSFTGSQLSLIKALKDLTECQMIMPETGLDDFHDGIKQLGSDYKNRPSWSINVKQLSANNSDMQFSALAKETALWAHGAGEFAVLGALDDYGDLGILARRSKLDILINSLERYKIPYNIQVRGTIEDTITGTLAIDIWNVFSGGFKTKETSYLVKNGILGFKADETVFLEGKFPKGYCEWYDVLSGKSKKLFKDMWEFCKKIEKGGYPSDVLRLWLDFLRDVRVCENASEIILLDFNLDDAVRDISSSLRELEKKIEAMSDLKSKIGPASDIKLCGYDAVSYIKDWSATATLPISLPERASVTVYSGVPPVLSSHRYWIMTDTDANAWPGRILESPLLTGSVKKEVNKAESDNGQTPHLTEIHEERQQKEALFRRLAATGRDGVIFTRSLTDSNGRPQPRSPFIDSMFSQKGKRTWHDTGSVLYSLSGLAKDDVNIIFPEAEVSSYLPKEDRIKIPRVGKICVDSLDKPRVSLSDLDTWNTCPYLYWCRRILKVDFQIEEMYDRKKAGIFTHSLWDEAMSVCAKEGSQVSVYVMRNYDSLLKINYPELLLDERLARYEKQLRKQVLDMAFLQDSIEFNIAKKRTGLFTEYRLNDYECDGVIFSGRADRIDCYGDGFVVLDYKLGKAENHKNDIQLAAYAAVMADTEKRVPLGFGWLGHRDKRLCGYFNNGYDKLYFTEKKMRQKDIDVLIEEAMAVMKNMAQSVKSGNYEAHYDAKQGSKCSRCVCHTICRKKEFGRVYEEEDESVRQEGDFNE